VAFPLRLQLGLTALVRPAFKGDGVLFRSPALVAGFELAVWVALDLLSLGALIEALLYDIEPGN
jgi:hypothetical protein